MAATETRSLVCVGCPIGCPLELDHRGREIIEVQGYECDRGAKYARQEFTDPRRELATTVRITGARWARLPVKTTGAVPRERVMEAALAIHEVIVTAPVSLGDVLRENLLGEPGVHVVATRSMERVERVD